MYLLDDIIRTRDTLTRAGVEFMFIGKGAAIMQGYADTTQDIDIYPLNTPENNSRLLEGLRALGFSPGPITEAEVLRGKDFIQLKGPFDLDIVFAPDGFESYAEAARFKVEANGSPVMSVEGVIRSKRAAGRLKDRESLYRLEKFKEYLDAQKRG